MTTSDSEYQPSPDEATLDAVDRFLASVYGDLDFMGRLDWMVTSQAHLTDADLGEVIEAATDEVVRQIRLGRQPDDAHALMFWVAQKKAGRLSVQRGVLLSLDEPAVSEQQGDSDVGEVTAQELHRWRCLVEQIDQGRPRQVWLIVVEAIEGGLDLLPANEIAMRLGISETAVWAAMTRGRQQLVRMAEAGGLVRMLEDGRVTVEYEDD